MLRLLGWEIAESVEKRLLFNDSFVTLGVQVSFSLKAEAVMEVKNKPGRVQEIEAAVMEIMEKEIEYSVLLLMKSVLAELQYQLEETSRKKIWEK